MTTLRRIAKSQVERADLRVEALAGAPGAQKGLLHGLFGQTGVAEGASGEAVQLARVRGVRLADVALPGCAADIRLDVRDACRLGSSRA